MIRKKQEEQNALLSKNYEYVSNPNAPGAYGPSVFTNSDKSKGYGKEDGYGSTLVSPINYESVVPEVQAPQKGAPLLGESPYKIPPSNYDIYPNTNYAAAALKAEKEGRFNDAEYYWGMRDEKIDSGYGGNYAKYNPYQYDSKYEDKIADLRNQFENYEDFSYDPMKDEAYKSLANVYSKNARDASANAMAQAMAANGGRGSSNAMIAANLAYQNKMAGLEAEIPALRQAAYDMYLGDLSRLRTTMGDYIAQDESDYARFSDNLGRRIENQKYLNEWNRDNERYEYEKDTKAKQQEFDNAYNMYVTTGMANDKQGDLLGVNPGTMTADSYKWLQDHNLTREEIKATNEYRNAELALRREDAEYNRAIMEIETMGKVTTQATADKLGVPIGTSSAQALQAADDIALRRYIADQDITLRKQGL